MNIDSLKSHTNQAREYNNFMKGCKLEQVISSPTRSQGGPSTLIDRILVKHPELYCCKHSIRVFQK